MKLGAWARPKIVKPPKEPSGSQLCAMMAQKVLVNSKPGSYTFDVRIFAYVEDTGEILVDIQQSPTITMISPPHT